jgi:carbonic anhydrase
LLKKIGPAIEAAQKEAKYKFGGSHFMDEVVKHNVVGITESITQDSTLLAQMVEEGEITIISAVYYVATGDVIFT